MKYFEDVMNIKSEGDVIVTCMGMIGGDSTRQEQDKIKMVTAMKAIENLKNGNTRVT